MNDIKEQANFFCDLTKQINSIYEDYARSVGLSYTSLYTLHMIALTENCTQKFIAEQMFLPKQTLNSVVSAFHKQGLVELREMAEKGKEFATQIFPQIEAAEQNSIARFNEEDRAQFLKYMQKYVASFAAEMKR